MKTLGRLLLCAAAIFVPTLSSADNLGRLPSHVPSPVASQALVPAPPKIDAKAYLLVDAKSGKVLAQKNVNKKLAPASLTKMMTMYVIEQSLRDGRVHLNDQVPVSKKAWRMGGSKMFIREGTKVPLEELLKGIVVASGNDACIAMAEFIAGSERAFVDLMNQQAQMLGMKGTHFTDATGMPHPDHYTTPHDLAILARALVTNFPEYYHKWYNLKHFSYNKITQPNRNRLLWRDHDIDGIKTGHTGQAGFCLIASGEKNGMRLISVVMGALSDAARTDDSSTLLNYGFRFFESHKLYSAGQAIGQARVWMGVKKEMAAGLTQAMYVTIPQGQYKRLKANMHIQNYLTAPVAQGQAIGTIEVSLGNQVVAQEPLIALTSDAEGSLWRRVSDTISRSWHNLVNGHQTQADADDKNGKHPVS